MDIASRCIDGSDDRSLWVPVADGKEVVSSGLIPDFHCKVDILSRSGINLSIRTRSIALESRIDFVPAQQASWFEIKRVKFLDLYIHSSNQ